MTSTIASDEISFVENVDLAVVVGAVAIPIVQIVVEKIAPEDAKTGKTGKFTIDYTLLDSNSELLFCYYSGRGRPDYRDYQRGGGGGGGGGRDRFSSPDRGGPPMKRMRTEWGDDGRPRYGGKLRLGNYTQIIFSLITQFPFPRCNENVRSLLPSSRIHVYTIARRQRVVLTAIGSTKLT